MTKLEEVARAICCEGMPCRNTGAPYAICQANSFMKDARIVVLAMREPIEVMTDAAWNDADTQTPQAGMVWRAMIDAILNEEQAK
jgi:hypothetical protein